MPLIDDCFAFGALLGGIFLLKSKALLGKPVHYTLGSTSSIFLLFTAYATDALPVFVLPLSLLFGFFCCVSVVAWGSAVTALIEWSIRGRIASIRYVANILSVALAVPIISWANTVSFERATYIAMTMSALFIVACFLLNKWQTTTEYIEAPASSEPLHPDGS